MIRSFIHEVKPDGTEIWWHTDGAFITIEHIQPVGVIIDQNRAAEAAFSKNENHGDLIKHAELPSHMYWDLVDEGVIEDRERLKRFLNDPDNKYLRTSNMRV